MNAIVPRDDADEGSFGAVEQTNDHDVHAYQYVARVDSTQNDVCEFIASLPTTVHPHSYAYVIAFENGRIKVGRTANPRHRVSTHQREAYRHDIHVRAAWISPAFHQQYEVSFERAIIEFCAMHSTSTYGREYFNGVSFDAVVSFATRNVPNAVSIADKTQYDAQARSTERARALALSLGWRLSHDHDEQMISLADAKVAMAIAWKVARTGISIDRAEREVELGMRMPDDMDETYFVEFFDPAPDDGYIFTDEELAFAVQHVRYDVQRPIID